MLKLQAMKGTLWLFFIGAVVGTLLDGLQTFAGVAYYTSPFVLKTAWWVPLLFGLAVVLIGYSHFKIHPAEGKGKGAFIGSLFFLILSCLTTACPEISHSSKLLLLVGYYFLSWGIFDRTPASFFLAVATAFVGSSAEIFLGKMDLYHYRYPDFIGIPYWLPAMYFHVSAAGGYLGRCLLSPGKSQISK